MHASHNSGIAVSFYKPFTCREIISSLKKMRILITINQPSYLT